MPLVVALALVVALVLVVAFELALALAKATAQRQTHQAYASVEVQLVQEREVAHAQELLQESAVLLGIGQTRKAVSTRILPPCLNCGRLVIFFFHSSSVRLVT